MRIDNKAVMSCFGENVLANDLGGRENVRKALDYLRSEVKKVVWPTRKQVFKNTVAVLAAMGAVGVVIWILDALLTLLRGLLLGA